MLKQIFFKEKGADREILYLIEQLDGELQKVEQRVKFLERRKTCSFLENIIEKFW